MANCQAKVISSGVQRKELRAICCKNKAVIIAPAAIFDGKRGVWLCAAHAPAKLLPKLRPSAPSSEGPNVGAKLTARQRGSA